MSVSASREHRLQMILRTAIPRVKLILVISVPESILTMVTKSLPWSVVEYHSQSRLTCDLAMGR